jgi:hypothetical protein
MKKLAFLCILALCVTFGVNAQNSSKYQALFVYNFTRFIEWPSSGSSEFVIGVLGKSSIYSELQTVASAKKVGSQSIVVKQFSNSSEVVPCQILFVSSEVTSQISQMASSLQSKNTLIITDRPGSTEKGAGINFVIDDGKQKFEISKSNVGKTGLKMNKQLLDMAMLTD